MKAKKGQVDGELVVKKLFSGNYASDLMSIVGSFILGIISGHPHL